VKLIAEGAGVHGTVAGWAAGADGVRVTFGGQGRPAALVGRLGTASASGSVEGPVGVSTAQGSINCNTNSFSLARR
jgi:hypothetical protein